MLNLPPPDKFGTYQAPLIGGPGSVPYSPVNQNVPPPSVNPTNPPLTMYGVQGPAGTDITTPESKGSNGFLDTVGSTIGHIAEGIGNVLNAPNYLIADPVAESYMEPMSLVDSYMKQFQQGKLWAETGGQQGSINPMDFFSNMQQSWQQNNAPGIVKFGAEMAANPLTYLSAGSLGMIQRGIKGLELTGMAGSAAESAASGFDPLIAGMTKYESAVNSAVKGITDFSGGMINANVNNPFMMRDAVSSIAAAGTDAADKAISFIPSDVAKDNARGILNQILPSGLVENILNYVPEEYTGIPISPISDYLNKGTIFGRQLGLPDYISLPDFRRIAVQNAQQYGYEMLHQTLRQSDDPNIMGASLRSIFASPNEQLSPSEGYVKSILQEPSKFSTGDISDLSKAVSGSLDDPNMLQTQSFNTVIGLYRRGALDTSTTLQSLANHLGVDLTQNPDAGNAILDAMRSQDQKSLDFIDDLTSTGDRRQMLDKMSDYAGGIADSEFTSGIQQQRLQNTLFDNFLDNFDSAYTNIWKGKVGSFTRSLNQFGIQTLGMPIMQVAESALRHVAEGGGMWASNIDKDLVMAENSMIPNVPFDVRRASYHGFTDTMDNSLLARVSGANPVLGWLADKEKFMTEFSNNSRNTMYLSYWRTALNQEIKSSMDAMGFTVRPDASAFMDAVKTPDVNVEPALQGVDQRFVNDIMNAGVKAAPSQDAINTVKNTLDASNINKYALSHAMDGDDVIFDNLGVAPRALLRDGIITGKASTSAGMADLLDQVIAQQKSIIKASPEVQAQMFEGGVNSMVDRANSPLFGPRDLNNSLGQVLGMQTQIANAPWVYRQAEFDAVNDAIRSPNGWRAAIHSESNQNIVDYFNQTNGVLNRAYDSLKAQGAKLGVSDLTDSIAGSLEADRLRLQSTWEMDKNFQEQFFATNPDKSNPMTWTSPDGSGYYDGRQQIWDGFGQAHAKNMADLQQAQIALNDRLLQMQANGLIEPNANTISHVTDLATEQDAVFPQSEVTWNESPGQHTTQIGDFGIQTNRNPTSKRWTYSITDGTGNVVATSGPFSSVSKVRGAAESYVSKLTETKLDDPVAQGLADIAEHGFQTGQTPTEITSALNDSINAGAGNATPESIINPSSQAVESQISGSIGNSTIDQSGNASAVIEPPNPDEFLGNKYATLESTIRPRVEEIFNQYASNPKVSQEAMDHLKGRLDSIYTEYQQLPQDTQKIYNDVLDVASQRASQRITQGFTNYNSRSNFDALALHFFPWWMHESQRWPWLTRTFIGKPTAISMWQAYQDQTNQGYVPLSELPLVGGVASLLPGGNSLQINPTRAVTPFNPIQPTNQYRPTTYDEGLAGTMQALDKVMSQIGVQPFDIWDAGAAMAQGNIGAELPTPIKSALNLARGSSVPGVTQAAANIQRVLPDNYRDYYTRMILASNGFEPDKVYDGALAGDQTDTATLDTAQQQSSLVQLILGQTGSLARFRTPEYNQYQDQRMKAVEAMTGIPQVTQLAMRNDGVSIRQLQAFSPAQREELANLPGANNFNELTEPLLNSAARKLRQSQREFYSTLDTERGATQVEQEADDRRLQTNVISGVEWRKRYQDRAGRVSDMLADLKKSPAYKDVPVSSDEQAQARARFNLPPYVMSPEDMALQQYYSIKPETDVVTGDVNWSKFFDDRNAVINQNQVLKPLLDAKLAKNNTPQVVDFKNAAETLRPYFGIKDQILAKYPQTAALVRQAQLIQNQDPVQGQQFKDNNPELKTLSALVRHTQQQARLEFPQIDQALVKYYGAQPAEYQNWAKKYESSSPRPIPNYQAVT